MQTSPRSRVRIASYFALLGWLFLFEAVRRPDSGSSWSYAHAGLELGGAFTLLAVILAAAAAFPSPRDGVYASAWLGGIAGVIFAVWVAYVLDSFSYGMSGLLSLGAPPDPQRDAVGAVVDVTGWLGLATALFAVLLYVVSSARRHDPENAKSRLAGG